MSPEPEPEDELKLASQESGVFPAEPQPETPPRRSALLDVPETEEGEILEEKSTNLQQGPPPKPSTVRRELFPRQDRFLFPMNERASGLQMGANIFLCGNCIGQNRFHRTVLEKPSGRQRINVFIRWRRVKERTFTLNKRWAETEQLNN